MYYSNVGTSNASNGTLTNLPHQQRKWGIQYTNEDGSVGCTAFPINYDELYNLKGRLLTLVDATFADPEQRKAQKDLVWATLRAWMDDIERSGLWQAEPGLADPEPAVR